ncbi:hypothetical protein GCM10009608_38980 [Pseudonocardia alaniniphila]
MGGGEDDPLVQIDIADAVEVVNRLIQEPDKFDQNRTLALGDGTSLPPDPASGAQAGMEK